MPEWLREMPVTDYATVKFDPTAYEALSEHVATGALAHFGPHELDAVVRLIIGVLQCDPRSLHRRRRRGPHDGNGDSDGNGDGNGNGDTGAALHTVQLDRLALDVAFAPAERVVSVTRVTLVAPGVAATSPLPAEASEGPTTNATS